MLILYLTYCLYLCRAQVIDLGYSKVKVSTSFKAINVWTNIRYAAPPVKDLRFAAPAKPLQETTINDGTVTFTCRAYTQDTS